MANEISCPVCDADLLLGGDEAFGDTVVCSYCGAPYMVTRAPSADEAIELEEDF